MILFLLIPLGYLLGSIPFGLLLTKYAGLGDIRAVGSGNIGATNVLRTGNKKLAAATLLLDAMKGFVAVALARYLLPSEVNAAGDAIPNWGVYAVGLAALLGHVYPVWLKFKGGKGVATALGVLLALSPLTFVITLSNWLVMFQQKRISSLSALFAFAFVPLWLWVFTDLTGALAGILYVALIFYTHRANIQRLRTGTEPCFKAASS